MEELKFLEEQNVSSRLIKKILEFREMYPVPDEAAGRITKPAIPFYGKEILEMAIAGLLQGQNLLLAGPKATGKNIWQKIWHIFFTDRYTMYRFT